jgi:1,4-dihydroxy-2-naphthoate octaprenyltransferase
MSTQYSFFRPDTAMWGKALRGVPRVKNKQQWQSLDPVSRWLIATRAAVLLMTLFSAIIAGIYARIEGAFQWGYFLVMAAGLVLAHATNNILNDLSDHRRGVDRDNAFRAQYGTQPVEQGLLTQAQSVRMALFTGLAASAAGVFLVLASGMDVLWFFLVGVVALFAYNWPLKHFGLGEPLVVVVWGPLMIGGGFLAITGYWSWDVALASLPYALGPTAVLFGKHIDKIPWDKPRGVRTLPVLLGERTARATTIGILVLQYLVVLYLILTGFFSWTLLIVLGALPYLFRRVLPVFRRPAPAECPPGYPREAWPLWFVSHAFAHNRKFGGLFLLGLVAQLLLQLL